MSQKKHIVTVINSITETSMPFNEFVGYRHSTYPDDEQSLIVCSKTIPATIKIPRRIQVYLAGMNLLAINQIIRQIAKGCDAQGVKLIVHLHQPASAVMFSVSTLFDNYRPNTVFTVHSLFCAYKLKNKVLSALSILAAAKVTCVSQASYEKLPGWIRKIKHNNITTILNGVDLDRIDLTARQHGKVAHDTRTLIYIARIIPIKNHRFLLEVFSHLKNCRLVLVGSEDKSGEIKKMIDNLQLENRIELTGMIPRDEVYRRLKEADIYVSPSLVEGLPVSLLEATYTGLPAVVSNIESHLEVQRQCPLILTLPLDIKQWVDQLNVYLSMNEDSFDKIGSEISQCTREKFSLGAMLKQYDSLYDEL